MNRSKDFLAKGQVVFTNASTDKILLLIDFGLSRRYDPANGSPLDKPYQGGDKSVPEHQDTERFCNPFPTDVYYVGNLVREEFIQVCVAPL